MLKMLTKINQSEVCYNSIVGDITLTWQSSSTDSAPFRSTPKSSISSDESAVCPECMFSNIQPVPTSVRAIGCFQLKLGDCSFAE